MVNRSTVKKTKQRSVKAPSQVRRRSSKGKGSKKKSRTGSKRQSRRKSRNSVMKGGAGAEVEFTRTALNAMRFTIEIDTAGTDGVATTLATTIGLDLLKTLVGFSSVPVTNSAGDYGTDGLVAGTFLHFISGAAAGIVVTNLTNAGLRDVLAVGGLNTCNNISSTFDMATQVNVFDILYLANPVQGNKHTIIRVVKIQDSNAANAIVYSVISIWQTVNGSASADDAAFSGATGVNDLPVNLRFDTIGTT